MKTWVIWYFLGIKTLLYLESSFMSNQLSFSTSQFLLQFFLVVRTQMSIEMHKQLNDNTHTLTHFTVKVELWKRKPLAQSALKKKGFLEEVDLEVVKKGMRYSFTEEW